MNRKLVNEASTLEYLSEMRCMLQNSILGLVIMFMASCAESVDYDQARTPEESIATFDLIEGFEVEVFAAEPHIVDPVELKFDASGNVYAVEMPDYPFKPEPGMGRGRIKKLYDDDRDGVVDRSSVFAEGISEATSILPWKGGLLVAAAPNILFLQDLDRDGKSDSTEILFSGFFENNSEAQITNLTFGLDNWIYASNHGQSGKVKYLRDVSIPELDMQGGDFRFRLDREKFELEAGPAQFGQAFNDRWHRFITQNSLHIRHVVIPWRYTHRHDYLPSTQVANNISDHEAEMFQETPPPHWRAERTARRQSKYDAQGLGRKEYAEDYFTGCSGGTFYDGDAFPQEFYGNIFTGDVAGNLIHRDVLSAEENSPSYVASRHESEQDREFLFSTDSWFRPTQFTVGPDGFLYVVDYYRQHIETPLSIPADLKEQMDFMNGQDMGRLYRIRPSTSSIKQDQRPLADLSSVELASILKHRNRWHRLTAQQLLLERQDPTCIPDLLAILNNDELRQPRLHALYALEGMGALSEAIIAQSLKSDYAPLREHALMLAERLERGHELISPLLGDSDIRVSFQAVLSMGQFESEGSADLLAASWFRFAEDPWFRMAILSSKAAMTESFARAIFKDFKRPQFGAQELGYTTLLANSNSNDGSDSTVEYIIKSLADGQEYEDHHKSVRRFLDQDDRKGLRKYLKDWLKV